MGGGWLFRELSSGETEVVLRHRFSTADDGPGTVERTLEALDRNSREELAALARIAERGSALDDLVFSFTDVVELPGGTEAVYEFVRRADLWPDRLPHVNKVALSERPDGIQQLEMETLLADGSAHLTRSVRVCASPEWIAYKRSSPRGCSPATAGCGPSARAPTARWRCPPTRWPSTPTRWPAYSARTPRSPTPVRTSRTRSPATAGPP